MKLNRFYISFFCDQIVSMVFGSQLINSAKQVTLMPTPLWRRHLTLTSGSMDSWSLSRGESIVLWSHWPFNSSSVMLRMKRLGFEKKNPSWLQIIEVETSLEFRLVLFGASQAMTEAAFFTIGRSRTIGYGKIRPLADYRSRMLIFSLIFLTLSYL